jgi:hypothetical protein
LPVQFNKSNTHIRDRRLDDAGQVDLQKVDAKKMDGGVEVKQAETLDPTMATNDVKAVVGDAVNNSRPDRRSAGSRGAVAGLSQSTPKPKKGKSVWQKAVTAAMIGLVALSLVGCGGGSNDPGPPTNGTRVEQQYDGNNSNPLEGRPARGSPLQVQMDNMSGGDRDVRTESGSGGVQAPTQNVHPDADRGATPGSAQVQGEINRRVDVEVRTGYVNQDKQANLGLGSARIQQQQQRRGSVEVEQGSRGGVQMQQQDLSDAERLELENGGGRQEVRRDVRVDKGDSGGRQVRQVRTTGGGGGVTFHSNGGSK